MGLERSEPCPPIRGGRRDGFASKMLSILTCESKVPAGPIPLKKSIQRPRYNDVAFVIVMEMNSRTRIADFWDNALSYWIEGRPLDNPDLVRWQESYNGKGIGKVDLEHYPDPIVGDIRGIKHEPRLVLLGLNPGIGYDSLQSHKGVWTQRIAQHGYTYCLDRSPAADPLSWKALHGKESTYWRNAVSFTRRWLNDSNASIHDILNFELYPWHSRGVNGKMQPPADLIQKYIWDAVSEMKMSEVFAFGKEWFKIAGDLGLERIALYGPEGNELPGKFKMPHWRLGLYRVSPGQVLIVSSQSGYSGPPGEDRILVLREVLLSLGY